VSFGDAKRRREFITGVATATFWPVTVRAQQPERMKRIGVLMGIANDAEGRARLASFLRGLQELGWTDGRNAAGGEVMLGSSNWIGRLEYLHYDFGRINADASINLVQPGGATFTAALTAGRQTIDLVRAGVSYKFGPEFAAAAAPAMLTKAPRMPAPLQTWAGFYLGAHGGYGWKDNDFSTNFAAFNVATSVGGIKSQGWLGGGQGGLQLAVHQRRRGSRNRW
jgi:hypothetical protein